MRLLFFSFIAKNRRVGSVVSVPTSRSDGREFEPNIRSQPARLGETVEQQVYAGSLMGSSRKIPCTRFVHRLAFCSVFLSHPLPRSFRFLALLVFPHGLEEDSLLCPVRTLSFYLGMTVGLVRRSSALFISPSLSTRVISRNALSFLLRKVLSSAGAVSSSKGKSVCAHSIEEFPPRFLFCELVGLKGAGFLDLESLGPFVAAGSVVSPP